MIGGGVKKTKVSACEFESRKYRVLGNKYRIVHHIKDISMTPLPSDTLSPSDWGDKRRYVSESGQRLIDIQCPGPGVRRLTFCQQIMENGDTQLGPERNKCVLISRENQQTYYP